MDIEKANEHIRVENLSPSQISADKKANKPGRRKIFNAIFAIRDSILFVLMLLGVFILVIIDTMMGQAMDLALFVLMLLGVFILASRTTIDALIEKVSGQNKR